MQPIVAVPSFICADAFNKFLPFCTGFAAGCMIWMVIAEVLPDAFKVTCFSLFAYCNNVEDSRAKDKKMLCSLLCFLHVIYCFLNLNERFVKVHHTLFTNIGPK